ncbi:hypothetical protein CHK_2785 [Christensenella hongkongensis]|uniref:Uncharacterized protein n=1 Tax=Christensenella hongkongensis TaxID=270498 RepID=A0A0M2NB83_9FIRM|nr:hypothetical protein CHK_2785 [Christensenella hongkongensis]
MYENAFAHAISRLSMQWDDLTQNTAKEFYYGRTGYLPKMRKRIFI